MSVSAAILWQEIMMFLFSCDFDNGTVVTVSCTFNSVLIKFRDNKASQCLIKTTQHTQSLSIRRPV